ncbi:helix-turn-helix transcriptional regulator [Bradyrhizobium sp. AZCC 1693]|uniref:helix-turn-helix transcriptional regulator n=1 Tax=Bradyrhizobium sp. AZCC 1693 TaxID=3117029 RepID=UPI002FF2EA1B
MNEPEPDTAPGVRQMVSISEVLKRLPVSRATLHRMVKEKRFPQAHELSPMRVGFFLDEVIAWQDALVQKRNQPTEETLTTGQT